MKGLKPLIAFLNSNLDLDNELFAGKTMQLFRRAIKNVSKFFFFISAQKRQLPKPKSCLPSQFTVLKMGATRVRAKKDPIFIISNILTKKAQVHQNRRSAKDQRTVRARREKRRLRVFLGNFSLKLFRQL